MPRKKRIEGEQEMKPRARKPRKPKASNGAGSFPVDEVVKMTELERLSVGKADAELANLLQAIRIHDLEGEKLAKDHAATMQGRAAHRIQLIAAFEGKQRQQRQTVQEVAVKYGMEVTDFAYDPESGVLHDVRNKSEAPR